MNYYNVGKIVNTQGIHGEVRVVPITDFPEQRFQVGNHLQAEIANKPMIDLEIDGSRKHKNFIILHFKGLDSINDVEFLKPSVLKIAETDLTDDDLQPGEYYYHQIIGLDVYDVDGNYVGKIKEILSPGANDVWVVERATKNDLLLPKIDQVIKQVDLEQKRVTVDILEGLDDDES